MLISTMDRINEIKAKRDQIASLYDNAFSDLCNIQKVRKYEVHGRYIYIMACKSRDRLSKYLFDRRIENKVI